MAASGPRWTAPNDTDAAYQLAFNPIPAAMNDLDLGAFSVSLSVRDLDASRTFYEKLGFAHTGGGPNYAILCNGTTVIGLFHGMFDGNILTFNPGLRPRRNTEGSLLEAWRVQDFTDVRAIQRQLLDAGVDLDASVDEAANPSGPGSLMLKDPDGNVILVDQFFDRPGIGAEPTGCLGGMSSAEARRIWNLD